MLKPNIASTGVLRRCWKRACLGGMLCALEVAPLPAQAPPIVNRYGPITIVFQHLTGTIGKDGKLHLLVTGSPVLSSDMPGAAGGADHYQLTANSIDYVVAGTSTRPDVSNAVAVGNVRMIEHSRVPPEAGRPAGDRTLQVTGERAEFHGDTQTVDVTGSPVLTLTDPRLAAPMVSTGVSLIRVGLANHTFDIESEANHQATIQIQPAGSNTP